MSKTVYTTQNAIPAKHREEQKEAEKDQKSVFEYTPDKEVEQPAPKVSPLSKEH